jgi:hypothetical protein
MLYITFECGFNLLGFMPTLYLVIEERYNAYEGHFLQDLTLCCTFYVFMCPWEFQSILVVNGGDGESQS